MDCKPPTPPRSLEENIRGPITVYESNEILPIEMRTDVKKKERKERRRRNEDLDTQKIDTIDQETASVGMQYYSMLYTKAFSSEKVHRL